MSTAFFFISIAVIIFGVLLMSEVIEDRSWMGVVFAAGIIFIGASSAFASAYTFGVGEVRDQMDGWASQLDADATYTVLGHAHDGESDVVFVRKDGTSSFYSVRVAAGPVPTHFAIANDRPVAVAEK